MENDFAVENSVLIHASSSKIWELLKLYLYGSDVTTNWEVDREILFTRERLHPNAPVADQPIIDPGRVLEIEKEKLLKFTFYSSMEGYADLPQNIPLYPAN